MRGPSPRWLLPRFYGERQGEIGGERGIRTLGRVSPTHAFQACSFNPRTSLRVFGINRLRASGSARKPNCDRNCDTPPKGLRSFTGVRALEHARRLQELLQTCRRIQGCLECGPTFGTENEVAPVQRFSAAHPPHVARSFAHAHYSLKVTLVP